MSHSPAPVSPAAGPAAAAPGTTRHGLPDDATVETFLRDGAVVLRGVLDAGALAVLERGIEVNLAAPSPFGLFASLPDDPGRFFEDFRCWQRIPVYEAILHDCALPAIAAQQMRRGEAAPIMSGRTTSCSTRAPTASRSSACRSWLPPETLPAVRHRRGASPARHASGR
jgi:hypothetical protein